MGSDRRKENALCLNVIKNNTVDFVTHHNDDRVNVIGYQLLKIYHVDS